MSRLRLADILSGISIAADLGYGLPPEEAMKSCLIATAAARRLEIPEPEVATTFFTALLFHVGCVSFSHEMWEFFGDDQRPNRAGAKTNFADPRDVLSTLIPEATRGMGALPRAKAAFGVIVGGRAFGRRYDTNNCEVARATARRIGLPESVQQALYQIHEWWNGKGPPRGLEGDEICLPARIARLATDAARFDELGGADVAIDAIRRRSGTSLDPSLVEMFVRDGPALLDYASSGDPRQMILEAEPAPYVEIWEDRLPEIATAFGDLADLKTPYTHGHSREVGRLSRAAAELLGMDRSAVMQLHLAALLHDLGRAAIPNSIWEKPGQLSTAEWEQVRMHAYHSERILAMSQTLQPIARMAGMHHERIDGSGYHRESRGREIPMTARVIAAADGFQAMRQQRAYRDALSAEDASQELVREAEAGRLDRDAVAAVLEVAGQEVPRPPAESRAAGLSDREVEVLRLVAEGCSNPEIARRLYVSRRTAEHHVQHIYAKIGLTSRAAAALFALEHDLLPPSA